MKFVIALCLAVVASAAPQLDGRPPVIILRDDRVDQGDGNFNYAFAADNGIEMEVVGTPGDVGQVNMRGFYLLPREDGSFSRVEFVANEGGFQPTGDAIPAMPAHALEQIRFAEEQRAQGIQYDIQGRRIN